MTKKKIDIYENVIKNMTEHITDDYPRKTNFKGRDASLTINIIEKEQ